MWVWRNNRDYKTIMGRVYWIFIKIFFYFNGVGWEFITSLMRIFDSIFDIFFHFFISIKTLSGLIISSFFSVLFCSYNCFYLWYLNVNVLMNFPQSVSRFFWIIVYLHNGSSTSLPAVCFSHQLANETSIIHAALQNGGFMYFGF